MDRVRSGRKPYTVMISSLKDCFNCESGVPIGLGGGTALIFVFACGGWSDVALGGFSIGLVVGFPCAGFSILVAFVSFDFFFEVILEFSNWALRDWISRCRSAFALVVSCGRLCGELAVLLGVPHLQWLQCGPRQMTTAQASGTVTFFVWIKELCQITQIASVFLGYGGGSYPTF